MATPIGHLQDITLRALHVLASVHVVYCEDTRRTRILLQAHGIRQRLISFHTHNESRRIPEILRRLDAGEAVALVSDAGMPGISDPGSRLVYAVWTHGHRVTVVPGPSAVLSALAMAGVPTVPFVFWGFVPRQRARKMAWLTRCQHMPATHLAFESGNRLLDTLQSIAARFPDTSVILVKEITKIHERRYAGLAMTLFTHLQAHPDERAGEWVIVLDTRAVAHAADLTRTADTPATVRAMARDLRQHGIPPRTTARMIARWLGLSANIVYRMMMGSDEGESHEQ